MAMVWASTSLNTLQLRAAAGQWVFSSFNNYNIQTDMEHNLLLITDHI